MTTTDGETLTYLVEREFTHSPEKLWRALTQPDLIAEWLMKNDFRADVGHRFKFAGDGGGMLNCKVLEVEPPPVWLTHGTLTMMIPPMLSRAL